MQNINHVMCKVYRIHHHQIQLPIKRFAGAELDDKSTIMSLLT